jgi:hypothetical protein
MPSTLRIPGLVAVVGMMGGLLVACGGASDLDQNSSCADLTKASSSDRARGITSAAEGLRILGASGNGVLPAVEALCTKSPMLSLGTAVQQSSFWLATFAAAACSW